MKKLLLLVVISSFFGACSTEKAKENLGKEQAVAPTSTTVLTAQNDYQPLSSFKKTRGADIITQLFDEALQKDNALAALVAKVKAMPKQQAAALTDVNTYLANNQRYWTTAQSYANNIQDTLLRKQTLSLFEQMEKQLSETMLNYKQYKVELIQKQNTLNDQYTLLQLMLTQQMMLNYLNNEKPATDDLDATVKEYDDIIEEVKTYMD